MKLKILAIVLLAVVGIGAAFVAIGGLPASAATTSQYLTSAAATGDVVDDVAATGTVAAGASYGVAFGAADHLAGTAAAGSGTWTVKTVEVAVGASVKTGDVLATADTADLKRQLADATLSYDSAKLQLKIARKTLANATTTDTTRQARLSVYSAKNQVSSARKTVDDLKQQIGYATLTSPIDGTVTAVNIDPGLVAPSGDAIIIDSAALEVTADVVESDLASMTIGQTAQISISAVDAQVTGTVTSIAPTTTGSTTGGVVSYPVTVSLDDAPATVRVGMTADITITIDSATNVLTVPSTALRGRAGSYTVLVLDADGAPTSQSVEVGLIASDLAEITSGLTDGQEVVTGVANAQTGTSSNSGGFGGGGFGGGGAFPAGGFGGGNGNRIRVGN
jgi:RND family efflux transporter MFP subunit